MSDDTDDDAVRRLVLDQLDDAPRDLRSGQLESAIARGHRRRRLRLAAQGTAVCLAVAAVVFGAVRLTTGSPGSDGGTAGSHGGCAAVPAADATLAETVRVTVRVTRVTASSEIQVTSHFSSTTSVDLSSYLPVDHAYVLGSRGRVVARFKGAGEAVGGTGLALRLRPGKPMDVSTRVYGLQTCSGKTIGTLPAGHYRLVLAYPTRALSAAARAPARMVVSAPAPITIP